MFFWSRKLYRCACTGGSSQTEDGRLLFASRIDRAGGEGGGVLVFLSLAFESAIDGRFLSPSRARALPDSPLPLPLPLLPPCHCCAFFPCRAQMFKMPVGTLVLLAEPAGQRPPCGDESAPSANAPLPPDAPSTTAQGRPQTAPATTTPASLGAAVAVTAPAAGSGGGGASGAAATSTGKTMQVEGGSRLTAAQRRASAVMAAPVHQQLELLGDLSRAVGHGEAALVCASLLRDEAGAKDTLR